METLRAFNLRDLFERLSEVGRAHADIESGRTVGKLILIL